MSSRQEQKGTSSARLNRQRIIQAFAAIPALEPEARNSWKADLVKGVQVSGWRALRRSHGRVCATSRQKTHSVARPADADSRSATFGAPRNGKSLRRRDLQ